jgi:hypothetical protein
MFVKTAIAATLLALTANAAGVEYKMFARKLTWKGAGAACKKWGGALASIKSAAEQKLVFAATKRTSKATWFGANDIKKEGAWRWADGSALKYRNWGRGEPNNYKNRRGVGEDCAAFWGRAGRWNDWWCTKRAQYICEKNREDPKAEEEKKTATYADESFLESMGAFGEAEERMRQWEAKRMALVADRFKKAHIYFSEVKKELAARKLAARWERDWLAAVKAHEAAIKAHKFSTKAMGAAMAKA